MTNILQLVQSAGKQSTVLEDAFLVAGTMASALEQDFHAYLPAFLPFLYPALKATEDVQLCVVAIGIIGDVCRALGEVSAQYYNAFMDILFENLQNQSAGRTIKIAVLSCFGDIALAIGGAFEPYLQPTMAVLQQAGEINPDLVYRLVVSLVYDSLTMMYFLERLGPGRLRPSLHL
jgi:importin subunit beta-1